MMQTFGLNVVDGTKAGTMSDAISQSLLYAIHEMPDLNLREAMQVMERFKESPEMQKKHHGNDSFPVDVNDMAFMICEYYGDVQTPICWWDLDTQKWTFTN